MQENVRQEYPLARFTPPDIVDRRIFDWPGLRAEFIDVTKRMPFEYRFKADHHHLLIASARAERDDGETLVDGLPKSTRRRFSGRLTFVPAGHEFYGWQDPRILTQVSYFYIDPRGPLFASDARLTEGKLRPRLFFADPALWRITGRLKSTATDGGAQADGESLVMLLNQELMRLNGVLPQVTQGGLSGWQQKKLTEFIEAHLSEEVSLRQMASLVGLSPYHFARAFKQSFGVPPHRYHVGRRIARAKAMLAERSVTEVALAVGFSETSSFSTAFRKYTGLAPSEYRRGLS
jgi:AraC family transcriptional regulator